MNTWILILAVTTHIQTAKLPGPENERFYPLAEYSTQAACQTAATEWLNRNAEKAKRNNARANAFCVPSDGNLVMPIAGK